MNKEIIHKIQEVFKSEFNESPLMVASPGRINLIGEHIDYNGGLVMPAAIDKCIYVGISKNDSKESRLISTDLKDYAQIDHNNLAVSSSQTWTNYISGVVDGLLKRGFEVPCFNMVFAGDIPLGAGLSSSAALENAVVFALNELYDLGLSKGDMILISQEAEHKFAGVQCGIMDQFASMMGKEDHVLMLNCNSLNFEYLQLELDDYELVLINTNVDHVLSDSPYNERKQQCLDGLSMIQNEYPTIKQLAHASIDQLKEFKDELLPVIHNRFRFVIEEMARVRSAKAASKINDWKEIGRLLYASHRGLQHLYEVSCPELDFLVDQTLEYDEILGSRMMGGGFGGCTLNLIKKESYEIINEIMDRFRIQFGITPSTYSVRIVNGTRRLLI